jgi:hypothetical protein
MSTNLTQQKNMEQIIRVTKEGEKEREEKNGSHMKQNNFLKVSKEGSKKKENLFFTKVTRSKLNNIILTIYHTNAKKITI